MKILLALVLISLYMRESCAAPERVTSSDDVIRLVEMERHQRNYFISGNPNTKAQFSFKFPLKKNSGHYLGYSQKLIWELFTETSSPVTDVNFNLEYFYRFSFANTKALQSLDVGIAHQSNGKSDLDSRSWNEVYLYLPFKFDLEKGKLFLTLKTFYLFDLDVTNRDARDYSGWYKLEMSLVGFIDWMEYHEFYVSVMPGGKEGGQFSRGGLETGLRFRIFKSESAPYGFIQYFTGYGESMAKYNEQTHAVRIGISI